MLDVAVTTILALVSGPYSTSVTQLLHLSFRSPIATSNEWNPAHSHLLGLSSVPFSSKPAPSVIPPISPFPEHSEEYVSSLFSISSFWLLRSLPTVFRPGIPLRNSQDLCLLQRQNGGWFTASHFAAEGIHISKGKSCWHTITDAVTDINS